VSQHLQVLELLWRSKCLQHPSVVPVLGIMWSLPSVQQLPPYTPILITECQELGALSSVSGALILRFYEPHISEGDNIS